MNGGASSNSREPSGVIRTHAYVPPSNPAPLHLFPFLCDPHPPNPLHNPLHNPHSPLHSIRWGCDTMGMGRTRRLSSGAKSTIFFTTLPPYHPTTLPRSFHAPSSRLSPSDLSTECWPWKGAKARRREGGVRRSLMVKRRSRGEGEKLDGEEASLDGESTKERGVA